MGVPEPPQEQDPWSRLSQPRCCTKVDLRGQEGWERMTLGGLYLESGYNFFFYLPSLVLGPLYLVKFIKKNQIQILFF